MARSKSRKIKRRRKQGQKQLKRLKSRLEQGHFRGREIIANPSGEAKMSDVLRDFVEPYRKFTDTEDAYRKLLTLGVVAWGAALLPKKEQQDRVDSILSKGIPTADGELETGLKEIVNRLIVRKETHFSEYRRDIIDFELKDTGSGYHLSVASLFGETSS